MSLRNMIKDEFLKYISAIFLLIALTCGIFYSLGIKISINELKDFFNSMEAKTFDFRQVILANKRQVNQDIVVIGIDNNSYEFLTQHYGTWPVPRGTYADIIDYLEADKPAVIGIDIVFVDAWDKEYNSDEKVINAFSKYDNLIAAIYFDDYPPDIKKPIAIPERYKANFVPQTNSLNLPVSSSMQGILSGIIHKAANLGCINIERNSDGVIRTLPLFWGYPQYELLDEEYEVSGVNYYPNFGLKLLSKYLESKGDYNDNNTYKTDKNNLIINDKKIPLRNNGEVVLNWYGKGSVSSTETFTFIPFKDVFVSMEGLKQNKKPIVSKGFFKDKIIIIGYTANGLHDIKTVPTDKTYPAMEIYATFINNILDNSVIRELGSRYNLIISFLLASVVFYFVYRSKSIFNSVILLISSVLLYFFTSLYLMKYLSLWIWVFVPVITIIMTFILAYVIKYFLKSKDFEHTYRLATTDELTGLYNYRFFQEHIALYLAICARYGGNFSIIFIDIDNFKNFNDTYGHLAGDNILRGVADVLKKCVRLSDMVFRYGGEELAVILPNTGDNNAKILAERICNIVRAKKFKVTNSLQKNVTISLGTSTYPQHGVNASELIEHADKCLYKAKSDGKNQVGIL